MILKNIGIEISTNNTKMDSQNFLLFEMVLKTARDAKVLLHSSPSSPSSPSFTTNPAAPQKEPVNPIQQQTAVTESKDKSAFESKDLWPVPVLQTKGSRSRQVFATFKTFLETECKHETCSCEDGKKTCLQCGELFEENYIINTNYFGSVVGMKTRKVAESSVYKDIPAFIDRRIKDLAVEIYNTATKNKTFRNASKRAVVLASLHRAAALMGDENAISFYDLLQMFALQQHEANKGFAILSSNIPKNSEFFLRFDNDREELISINSKIKLLGIEADARFFRLVANIFNLFKTRSNTANESQYNSVICGCIYFWVVYLGLDYSINVFAKTSKVSKTTLLRVYCAVCDVVFNNILKELFSLLLKNCVPVPFDIPHRCKTIFKKTITNRNQSSLSNCAKEEIDLLYGPEEKCLVFDPFDHTRVKVIISDIELPLDHVDDTLEWNILLSRCYFTPTTKLFLMVTLFRRVEKRMYFDFTEYDAFNQTKGDIMLRELLIKKFDTHILRTKNN